MDARLPYWHVSPTQTHRWPAAYDGKNPIPADLPDSGKRPYGARPSSRVQGPCFRRVAHVIQYPRRGTRQASLPSSGPVWPSLAHPVVQRRPSDAENFSRTGRGQRLLRGSPQRVAHRHGTRRPALGPGDYPCRPAQGSARFVSPIRAALPGSATASCALQATSVLSALPLYRPGATPARLSLVLESQPMP